MMKGIYVATSGALAIQRQMANIANNLANIDTSGYKKNIPVFTSISAKQVASTVGGSSTLPNPLTYTAIAQNKPDFTQGPLVRTGDPMQVALEGPGFFTIQTMNNEIRYTRTLNLVVTRDGRLLTKGGERVIGQNNRPIENLTEAPLEIGPDGGLSQEGNLVGQLKMVDFPKPYPLEKVGYGMYRLTQQVAPTKVKNTVVHQGMVEKPNVSPVREMTQMIVALRGYEAYQKVITSMDDLAGKAVNDLGRVG